LSFLYTCRQIYHEAHLLAYAVSFSVTNRWHRDDLEDLYSHFASRPDGHFYPITKLELASQWRQQHELSPGSFQFLDSFQDYATFVWNCLEIFESLETIIVNTEHKQDIFARRLSYVLALGAGESAQFGKPHQEAVRWVVHGESMDSHALDMETSRALDAGYFTLSGYGKRKGRSVLVQAKPIEKEDLKEAIQIRFRTVSKAWYEAVQGLLLRLR
jgi:hypothetical protein